MHQSYLAAYYMVRKTHIQQFKYLINLTCVQMPLGSAFGLSVCEVTLFKYPWSFVYLIVIFLPYYEKNQFPYCIL
jgi:hypothetical protein